MVSEAVAAYICPSQMSSVSKMFIMKLMLLLSLLSVPSFLLNSGLRLEAVSSAILCLSPLCSQCPIIPN